MEQELKPTAEPVQQLEAERERPRSMWEQADGEAQRQELILIGLSGSPNCMRVIRAAGRLARQLNARLQAVYVESKKSGALPEHVQKNLEESKNLAKSFGATLVTAYGEDIAYQLAETAKVSGAKKLFIGMSVRDLYRRREDVGVLAKKYMPSLDIYIIPGFNEKHNPEKLNINAALKERTYRSRSLFSMFLWLIAAMAVCTAIGVTLQRLGIPYVNIVMIYILGVLVLSTLEGNIFYMALTSFTAVMTINFFYVEPLYCFRYDKPTDLITFFMIFIMAFTISAMVGRLKYRFDNSHKRNMRTDILFDNSTLLLKAQTTADVEKTISDQLIRLTGMSVVIYSNYDGVKVGPKYYPRSGMSVAQMYPIDNSNDREVVDSLLRGETTEIHANGTFAFYLPVTDDKRTFMVVGLYRPGDSKLPAFELGIITSMLNEAALVIHRILLS